MRKIIKTSVVIRKKNNLKECIAIDVFSHVLFFNFFPFCFFFYAIFAVVCSCRISLPFVLSNLFPFDLFPLLPISFNPGSSVVAFFYSPSLPFTVYSTLIQHYPLVKILLILLFCLSTLVRVKNFEIESAVPGFITSNINSDVCGLMDRSQSKVPNICYSRI